MKHLNKVLLIFIAVLSFAFLADTKSYSQLTNVVHDLGKIGESWNFSLDYYVGRFAYPAGEYRNEQSANQYPHFFTKSFIKKAGDAPTVGSYWYRYLGNRRTEELMIYKRHTPPQIICNGINYAPQFPGAVDATIDCDSRWNTKVKFWDTAPGYMRITSRMWVNQLHDDYNIKNWNFELSLDLDGDGVDEMPTQEIDVMIGLSNNISPTTRGFYRYNIGSGTMYTNKNWRECKLFPQTLSPAAPRTQIPISLSWNADRSAVQRPYTWTANGKGGILDDSGDPWGPQTGALTIHNSEIYSAMYGGHGTFYVDKSVTDKTDATNMPTASAKTRAWGHLGDYSDVWKFITESWDKTEDQMGYLDPYLWSGGPIWQWQSLGPWKMKKGESINIVAFGAIGATSSKENREKGVQFMQWYRDGIGTFDNAAKTAYLTQSRDSLVQNVDRAYWNYSVRKYNIRDPLGPPNIIATAGPDKNTIEWNYNDANGYKDPDTGSEDFLEWRLYRKLGHFQVNHDSDNGFYDYELIGVFPKATTKYEDTGVIRGQSYHYAVTAVDDGTKGPVDVVPNLKLESSLVTNRTVLAQIPFKVGLATANDVLVIPNPYNVSTGTTNAMNYTGATNDLHFVNLPAYCTLKIYTATGDLIKTIEHSSGSGDEIWANMRTTSNQYPASGVYVLVVDNAKDINNNTLPKKIVKFVIVR